MADKIGWWIQLEKSRILQNIRSSLSLKLANHFLNMIRLNDCVTAIAMSLCLTRINTSSISTDVTRGCEMNCI